MIMDQSFRKLKSRSFSLGISIETSAKVWVDVAVLLLSRMDNNQILYCAVDGASTLVSDRERCKIAEIVSCNSLLFRFPVVNSRLPFVLSSANFKGLEGESADDLYFKYVFLSKMYDWPVVAHRSYSNLGRIHLDNFGSSLHRAIRLLNRSFD